MIRATALLLASAILSPAWVESVEFPWDHYPRELWERELVGLRNSGAVHVSLPQGNDPEALADVIQIIRRLNLEADLEGPVPPALEALTIAHGGPLTAPPPGPIERISVLRKDAITHSRTLLGAGAPSVLWTDIEDTLDATGYHAGAINFAGEARPSALGFRRALRLYRYWGVGFPRLREAAGAGLQAPAEGVIVRQFTGDQGDSVVSVVNRSDKAFAGDIRVVYPALKRTLLIPGVKVAASDALWLPVSVPLLSGPLCKDCLAFATVDHLVYATVELTAMEYENGILAMEFYAPAAGEAVLQMSRQPTGPLVAGGKLLPFDWDDRTQRVRIPVPAGAGDGKQVRVGIAIEAPESTAFFDTANVLLIGEQNRLIARFSSPEIADRSRLRTAPDFQYQQQTAAGLPALEYRMAIPQSAVHGDRAELTIEADGRRISHANPAILSPVTVRYPEAIAVRLASDSSLPLFPATIPVNRRQGRDVTISLRNNAPGIRTFRVELHADGIEFSPPIRELSIGQSATREFTFRAFTTDSTPGVHTGSVKVTGDAMSTEAVRFLVLDNETTHLASGMFDVMENARFRAVFMAGRWLEYLNKDSGKDALPAGGVPFDSSKSQPGSMQLDDLPALVPKPAP